MPLLGINAKGYLLANGTRSSWGNATAGICIGTAPGNLTEMSKLTDVTMNLEKNEVDVSTRGNNGWEAILSALRKASCELKFVYDTSDTTQQTILSAWLTDANVALALLDGASSTTGTQGLWADFTVSSVTKEEGKDGAQMLSATVKPALTSVAPQWIKVGNGT